MSINTYRASSALTITLASLATSSGLTVGRCSTSYSNATNKDEILALAGQVTTGTSTLTAGTIEVWVFAQRADSTWPDLFSASYTGTDGGFTVRDRNILFAGARLVAAMATNTTNSVPYSFGPFDISQLFGYAPKEIAVFVTHNTGQNLSSTGGNHAITVNPAYY